MNPFVLAALLQAGGSIGGGLLSRSGNKETKQQKLSRKTAEDLLASMRGEGPYSDLFRMDEESFNKSYVEPAKALYKNQIAPQIQQSYIASGQQRGSGMEDQLLRAGVDLDQLLNQEYMNWQGKGKDRMTQILGSILNLGPGAANPMSAGEAAGQGAAGFFASDAFGDLIQNLMKSNPQASTNGMPDAMSAATQAAKPLSTPKGFAPDWGTYAAKSSYGGF